MNHLEEKKKASADRRRGDRRTSTDSNYAGPERRQGERRMGDRRSEPRSQ
jgi:hypothetical protein